MWSELSCHVCRVFGYGYDFLGRIALLVIVVVFSVMAMIFLGHIASVNPQAEFRIQNLKMYFNCECESEY